VFSFGDVVTPNGLSLARLTNKTVGGLLPGVGLEISAGLALSFWRLGLKFGSQNPGSPLLA
jgi:hypothetical protein